jgi:putative nucleotidyltransferase with HDIG domain
MTLRQLYDNTPLELKKILFNQWQAKQNPKWHPEGNTLKHIVVVTKRAIDKFSNDIDLILSAYFHDLGKMDTYEISPKSGQPTAYGHEKVSANLVDEFSSWIKSMGGNLDKIRYIVGNHMKIKSSTWDMMKDSKKQVIMDSPYFSDLEKFGTIDKGGLFESMDMMSKNLYDRSDNDFQHMIGNRVEFEARGKKWVGIAEFIGINPLHNQFQVTVDRTPVWPVNPNTIKLSPMRPKRFP